MASVIKKVKKRSRQIYVKTFKRAEKRALHGFAAAPGGTRDKEAELLSPSSFAAMPCLYGPPTSKL